MILRFVLQFLLVVVWCHSGLLLLAHAFVFSSVDDKTTKQRQPQRPTTATATRRTRSSAGPPWITCTGSSSSRSSPAGDGGGGSSPLFVKRTKWDDLVDEDDEDWDDNTNAITGRRLPDVPNDMKHNERNIQRQYDTFQAIVSMSEGGSGDGNSRNELVSDVYVRNPADDSDAFWLTGKVARVSDVAVEDAILRQWGLIVEHAASMRPDQFDKRTVEVWYAPGDTEIDVVYNNPAVVFTKLDVDKLLLAEGGPPTIKRSSVGYQGESFGRGFEAFRTWRNVEDGTPKYPEVIRDAPLDQETEDAIDRASTAAELQDAIMNRNNHATSTPSKQRQQRQAQQRQRQAPSIAADLRHGQDLKDVLLKQQQQQNDGDGGDELRFDKEVYVGGGGSDSDDKIDQYLQSLDDNRNELDDYIKQRKEKKEGTTTNLIGNSNIQDSSWDWLEE